MSGIVASFTAADFPSPAIMLDPSDTDAFYNDTSPPDVHHAAVGVPRAASVCNVTKSNSSHLLPGAYSNALANSLSSARSCMPNDSDVLRGNQPCAEPVKAKAAEAKCFPDAGPCFGRPLRLDGQMDFAERTAGDGGKQNANFAVSQVGLSCDCSSTVVCCVVWVSPQATPVRRSVFMPSTRVLLIRERTARSTPTVVFHLGPYCGILDVAVTRPSRRRCRLYSWGRFPHS